MSWEIEFSMQAQAELKTHLAYYDGLAAGLGNKFSEELSEYLLTIAQLPNAQVRYDKIRCVPMKRFPYMIHFSIIEARRIIRVQAIVHTSRNPDKNWGSEDWIVSEEANFYLNQIITLEFSYASYA